MVPRAINLYLGLGLEWCYRIEERDRECNSPFVEIWGLIKRNLG